MAQKGPNDGYPYPWGGNTRQPDLRHVDSTISDVSSMHTTSGPDLRHQVSSLSGVSALDTSSRSDLRHPVPPVPDLGFLSMGPGVPRNPALSSYTVPVAPRTENRYGHGHIADEIDISRVRINSGGNSSIPTTPASASRNHGRLSQLLPETLRVGSPASPSTRSLNPFRSPTQKYEPVNTPDDYSSSTPRSSGSKRYSKKRKSSSRLSMSHSAIPEGEEIDMSLLGSAMPMGLDKIKTSYDPLAEEHETVMSPVGMFDVSSFMGPPQTQEQVREVNQAEAAGILTGGLGAGLKPDTTITSTDLYANVPQTPTMRTPSTLGRRMSFRNPMRAQSFRNPGLARAPTVRELGQREANKRGKIIEVIVEEPQQVGAPMDLSTWEGSQTGTLDFEREETPKQGRKNTLPRSATVEVFYPQANWKPFSMRWPYLSTLILISVVLASAQEYLLQKSNKGPLYSFTKAASLNTWDYFTFKYLPTMVAVSFGVLWQVTDFEVKRLEAYYQLSREGGALAAESINVDYITFFNFLRPVKALQFKHYAVAVSSLATLIAVSLVPTLQAASIDLKPDRQTRESDPTGTKEIYINAIWSRFLSVLLVIIALMGCVLLWQLERRPSGLVADVKGIAGIAAMANRSHILMDFKDMDTATPETIHQSLKFHRYSLCNSSLTREDKIPLTQEEKDKYDQQVRPENPHPLMLRLVAGIPFIIGMILFMIFIPIVLFNPNANILTEKAPWLLTMLAVGIKLAWSTLETDVRMIEPFYILSRRHASPKVLTLDYTAMAWGWMPVRAFLNRHYLVCLVGLGSVLAEVLTVCSTSFANVFGIDFATKRNADPNDQAGSINSGEETFLSFWLSFSLSIVILSYLVLISVFVYSRRRHPFLPRQPNTIASILAFIHQSKMLYDFVGTEKMNNDEMVERLGKIGKTYGLGWFLGRDGRVHCGVDEEELSGGYRHGDDARKASQPWRENWETF